MECVKFFSQEKLIDPTAVSSPVVMQQPSYAPYTQGVVSNKNEGFVSYHGQFYFSRIASRLRFLYF